MSDVNVLGIDVAADLVERWRGWFAPRRQPFRTDLLPAEVAAEVPAVEVESTPEWVDTFATYAGTWTWLDETEFRALRPEVRRALNAVRRITMKPKLMPVWPSRLARSGDRVMFKWIESGTVQPSRHEEVPASVWRGAATVLPEAEKLAGTFPDRSGPNCFGTVMAGTGLDVARVQVGPDQFQSWLDARAERVTGTKWDDEPGVVFTWIEHEKLAHATVSLGGGWMFGKGSQAWSSPRFARSLRDTVNRWRYPTTRLRRHRLVL